MTCLSVNLNKIALLRNSRGRDFPNVVEYAGKFCDLGVHGITVHPRQDERHVKIKDAYDLAGFLSDKPNVEFNIEGYPSEDFIRIIKETKPDQCTLVPDDVNQLTSDHGWDLTVNQQKLKDIIERIKDFDVRVSVFLDPDVRQVELCAETETDRVELYTESYANAHATGQVDSVLEQYRDAAERAQELAIGVNAGHDLDLDNLPQFLEIKDILEVSIGHVLTVECIQMGMKEVVKRYLSICNNQERGVWAGLY